MRPRIHIQIVAIIALLVNGLCLCVASAPACSAPSCAVHEHQGACPIHQRHQHSPENHKCCQTAACNNSSEIRADTDSHATNHSAPFVFAIRASIGYVDAVTRLMPISVGHSPPSTVPLFLSIRTLLL